MPKPTAILTGVGGALFGFVALELTTPSIGRQVLLVAPPDVINNQRLFTLVLNMTEGLQFGLATFLVWSCGHTAWVQRRARPLPLGAVIGTAWILVGVWLQRMLTNLFKFREQLLPWGVLFDLLFILSAGMVVWFMVDSIRPESVRLDDDDQVNPPGPA